MLDMARQIQTFGANKSEADFAEGSMERAALERMFEILGIATMRVSEAFRAEHPEVPWRRIVGLRNVIAHQYDDVLFDRVWRTLVDDIPELIELLEPLIPPLPGEPS
jgi:uncharacterized protein with HEPN domain